MAIKAPLAMIHCGLGKASNWRPLLNHMDRPVSPLLIELPGHGLAEDYDETRDFADQAIEMALDEMPSEAVPLIGHSLGAAIALRIAIERPYRVSSLVLIEPIFFAAVKGRWAYEKLMRDLSPFDKRISAGEHATAAKEFHALWGDGRPWSEIESQDRSYMVNRIQLVPRANPLVFEDRARLLDLGRLESLDMPVTFIDGGDTHPIIPEIISTLGDRIPDAEWVSIPNAGHLLPMTHPELTLKAMEGRLFVEPRGDDHDA